MFHALRKVRERSQGIRAAARWSPQLAPQSPPSRQSFNPETPRPNPQSQSLSRGYGSILPTSLIYIVLSTRGCSPWRPEAVMSTTRGANKSRHWVFTGRRERTGRHKKYAAFPDSEPYRRSIRFQGPPRCQKEKRTLSGALANVPNFVCVTTQYPRPGSGILT